MWLLKWLMIWGFTISYVRTLPAPDHIVGINEPFCTKNDQVLFCDYFDSDRAIVQMNLLQTEDLKKVFLYNIKKLSVTEPLCINTSLHNVQELLLRKETDGYCNVTVELAARKCTIERLPDNIDSLHLEECKVNSLSTKLSPSKLSVINSNISFFDMQSAFAGDSKIVLQGSTVSKISKMIVGSGADLLIQKSKVNAVESKGIKISGGTATLRDSIITAPEGSVVIRSGQALTVENLQGKMTVSVEPCHCSEVKQGLIESGCPSSKIQENDSYLVLFIIVLLLLILIVIAMAILVFYWKAPLFKIMGAVEQSKTDRKDTLQYSKQEEASSKENSGIAEENQALLLENAVDKTTDKSTENLTKDKGARKKHRPLSKSPKDSLDNKHVDINRTDFSTQTEDLISIKSKQVLSKYENEQQSYSESDRRILNRIKNLKQQFPNDAPRSEIDISTDEIDIRFDRILNRYKYLGFLQTEEMVMLNSFVTAQWNFGETYMEEAMGIIEKLNSFANMSFTKSPFETAEKNLEKVLKILKTPYSMEEYKSILMLPKEELDHFQKLKDLHKKKTSKWHKVFEIITRIIREYSLKFKTELLKQYELEIANNIKRTEHILKYMTGDSTVAGVEMHKTDRSEQKVPENAAHNYKISDSEIQESSTTSHGNETNKSTKEDTEDKHDKTETNKELNTEASNVSHGDETSEVTNVDEERTTKL